MNRLSSILVLALMSLLISCKVFDNTSTESDSTSKAWVVSTFGTGLRSPPGVAVDSSGNVYVADSNNNRIRKITLAGVVTTLAGSDTPGNKDGAGNTAQFRYPSDVAVDSSGNVYVADERDDRIRKIEYKVPWAEARWRLMSI